MYSNSIICNILKYINENINNKISIDELENTFHYNRYYIMKLFKKELNITIIDYINKIRIYNSIIQIRENNISLLRIAYNNGFYSLEYYSEIFRKVTGFNPQLIKNYFKNKNISEKDITNIKECINNLYIFKQNISKYIDNEKKEYIMPKVLSIFK